VGDQAVIGVGMQLSIDGVQLSIDGAGDVAHVGISLCEGGSTSIKATQVSPVVGIIIAGPWRSTPVAWK
jgi:hypothetical protein